MPGEPGPPDEPSKGGGDGDDDDPFGSNNDDDYGYEDQGDRLFLEMTRAITELARSNHNARQPQPLPDPLTQARVRKPDQFDGSDTCKLHTFFVQCKLNFQDRP